MLQSAEKEMQVCQRTQQQIMKGATQQDTLSDLLSSVKVIYRVTRYDTAEAE
jgi:hypothetical protein